jgi:hypothetical protein
MKRFVSLLVATLLVMALVVPAISAPATVSAAEPTPPVWAMEQDLMAGQNIDVGTVYVWNDANSLYVKYETTGGWVMTETHLAVATALTGIPQTKTSNPIPGQFAYSTTHVPPVTEWTYTVPLAGLGDHPVIAAHAAVQLPQLLSAPIAVSIYSSDLLDTVLHIAEGNPGYPTGYPGPYPGTSAPAVLTWTHDSWPTISGAQWISSANLVEDPDNNSWRLFTRNIVIPSNAVNITGTLTSMTADNAEEVYLNSIPIGSDGEVYGPFIDNQEWNTIETYSGLNLLPGTNTLKVMVRNYAWPGGVYANPTGLIYKMDYQYQIVERELQTETAWAKGPGFSGKNWATYFPYNIILFPFLLDTVTVNANNPLTTYSTTVLEIGKNYQLKVSGTAYANDTIWFDAKYSNSTRYSSPPDSWTDYVAGYAYLGTDLLNLRVNGAFVDWGAYNPDHIYYWNMAGDDSPLAVALWIYDIPPYSNNSGSLTVQIYWMP